MVTVMNRKAAILGAAILGVAAACHFATWSFGAPAARACFCQKYLEYRLRKEPMPESQVPSQEECNQFCSGDHMTVRHAIPLLPGLILVSHEESYGWEGVSGTTLVLWCPGWTRVLCDVG